MARLRGRAERGERVIGRVPWGHWKILTFVAGLRHDGITAPFVPGDRSERIKWGPPDKGEASRKVGTVRLSGWDQRRRYRRD
jgi:hypothetical protein